MQSHSVDASPMKEGDLSHDKVVSVKEKEESSLSGASPKADEGNELHTGNLSPRVKEEMNDPAESSSPSDLVNTAEKTSGVSSSVEEEDEAQIIEDPDDQIHSNACNQLVVYDPQANGVSKTEQVPGAAAVYQTPPLSNNVPKPPPKVLPSVGAFTVQCANCFKWRLIPTKEKYEEIRESILQFPFVCEKAREWRPGVSCDDPADISQDGSRLWAIDKPNIAQPPPGWERLLRIRGEGSTKFADVYYQAPSGKKLRSMVDVQKFLLEHPEYIRAGVTMSQFSFQIPRPLQENYVRKRRPVRVESELPMPGSLEPTQASPLSWINPETETGGSGESVPPYFESPILNRTPPSKKRATKSPSKQMYNRSSPSPSPSPLYVKMEDPTLLPRDSSFDI